MIYNKKTGDVVIIDKSKGVKKNIIRNIDDLERERAALTNEVNNDKTLVTGEDKAARMALINEKFKKDFDVDPAQFQVFSRDGFRVDVGLIIQRPPIFVKMNPRDIEHLKMRSQVMNEFHVN